MEHAENKQKSSFILIMIIYLAGIFMGAIDTGIITPARTIIQNNLMVDEQTGIWMITIYTLAYAASIPVMGKLADKYGRKSIYLTSIFLFGLGSLLCGLSQNVGSFSMLLTARAIQAVGGGGIVPVATAEFGTTFPPEKRGMALGLVGGVYGIANIFGASAGSVILDIFGKNNWQFIFYVNLPITAFILLAGFLSLPNTRVSNVKKIDFLGISVLTAMVLSLLYGLRNIDFFDLGTSLYSESVYPFLIMFFVLLPLFIFAEKRAEDPVMNLSFFTNPGILITLILAFITGIILMGMIFVPQFSENALKITSGKGGYFVIILGLFAGIGAPVSGRLIDKIGAKLVLMIGFLVSISGSLFLFFVATDAPNKTNVVISLILIGIGMGITIGAPLNYMMLENTKKEESNSALAALSLIRSIGTAVAPAVMIGFLAHAGVQVQPAIMKLLPQEVNVPSLPYAQELDDTFTKLKTDPATKEQFADINIPDLTAMNKVEINMSTAGTAGIPDELMQKIKSSDVTDIVENTVLLSDYMFDRMTPEVIDNIQTGINGGIGSINQSLKELEEKKAGLEDASRGIETGIAEMQRAVDSQEMALSQLKHAGKSKEMDLKISELQAGVDTLTAKIEENRAAQANMLVAIQSMTAAGTEMKDTVRKMEALNNAVPGAFETAKENYIAEIYDKKDIIENKFQRTLNEGFKQVYMTVSLSSALALLILIFYRKPKVVPVASSCCVTTE